MKTSTTLAEVALAAAVGAAMLVFLAGRYAGHNLSRFFIRCSGQSPERVEKAGEQSRYVRFGVSVLLTTAMTFGSIYLDMHSTFRQSIVASIVAGALVAGFVYNFDQSLAAEPLMSDSVWYRTGILLKRAVLMFVLAAFSTINILMWMLHGQLVAQAQQVSDTYVSDGIARLANSPLVAENTQKSASVTTLNDEIAGMSARAQQLSDAYVADTKPCSPGSKYACNGDFAGPGSISTPLYNAWQDYLKNVQTPTTSADNTRIAQLKNEIQTNQVLLDKQHADLLAHAPGTSGGELFKQLGPIVRHDPIMWFVPAVLIVLELMVAILKILGTAGQLDYAAREDKAKQKALETARTPAALLPYARRIVEAEGESWVQSRGSSDAVDSTDASDHPNPAKEQTPRNAPISKSMRRGAIGATGAALVLAILATSIAAHQSPTEGTSAPAAGSIAKPGQSIDLGGGETFTLPAGAITNNKPVRLAHPNAGTRTGYQSLTASTSFATDGTLTGRPFLSLALPVALRPAAAMGQIVAAYKEKPSDPWTTYPTAYNDGTGTITATMTHFSIWTWLENINWAEGLADITQTVGELNSTRAAGAACADGLALPSWFNTDAGIGNAPDEPIRACVQGHATNGKRDDTLDVELVNNRAYGMFLSYGSAVQWGWQEDPTKVADAIRDGLLEAVARTNNELYMPPLSRASIGITNPGPGKYVVFKASPSSLTIATDILAVGIDQAIKKGISAAASANLKNKLNVLAASSCGDAARSWLPDISKLSASSIASSLSSGVFACLKDLLKASAGALESVGLTGDVWQGINTLIDKLNPVVTVGAGVKLAQILTPFEDLWVDGHNAWVNQLGYGFSILAHSQQPTPTVQPKQASTPKPTSTAKPTNQPTRSVTPPILDHGATPSPLPAGGLPPSPLPTPAPSPATVAFYDTWASPNPQGIGICRGNPAIPSSTPGGTVSEIFTSPTSGTLTAGLVQIDVAPETAHAQILINGILRASDDESAINDTRFNFTPVSIAAGDTVELRISFTASAGSVTTVYYVPEAGTFTATNTCTHSGIGNGTFAGSGIRATLTGIAG